MKRTPTVTLMAFALLAATLSPAAAADPNPDQLLRAMSAKLGAARNVTFETTRTIDPSLIPNRNLPLKAEIEISVMRPNKFMSKSSSDSGDRYFYADGQKLTAVDADKNLYATVPMRTSINGLATQLQEDYGITVPLLDLARSNIYQDIRHQVGAVSYLGRSDYSSGFLGFNNTECDRVGLSGKLIDTEVWLGVTDQLPRKLIFTVKNSTGKPQVVFNLSNWNLTAPLSDKDFAFDPPAGAMKISMVTGARIKSTVRKARHEATQIHIDDQSITFGWVAARGAGGRGFVAAGGSGYGYGSVAYRGGYYGGAARLPYGYYGAVPGAYRSVYYGGYNCYYAGGVYYRPAFYQGNTVYIVVR